MWKVVNFGVQVRTLLLTLLLPREQTQMFNLPDPNAKKIDDETKDRWAANLTLKVEAALKVSSSTEIAAHVPDRFTTRAAEFWTWVRQELPEGYKLTTNQTDAFSAVISWV